MLDQPRCPPHYPADSPYEAGGSGPCHQQQMCYLQESHHKTEASDPRWTPCGVCKVMASYRCVGVNYAGPILVKSGPVCKPIFTKGYVAAFVCLSTKAVHLELMSDLTTTTFIVTLCRFRGSQGIVSTPWSDHGTNFVGAEREIHKLLQGKDSARIITCFCNLQKNQQKVHTWACSSPWGIVGSCSQVAWT